jgi:esterase/lipase superfamily enzyme
MADRAIELEGGRVLCYGHWGRPVIAFPSERGEPWDWEDRSLVAELGPLFEAGRLKLYCISSYDSQSWQSGVDLEEAARRHGFYEWWVTERVVPFVQDDAKTHEVLVTGASFGAYHAANFCLKRGDLFPVAICMSGVYDVTVTGGGERGEAVYFNNPIDYVQHLHGDHLDWLRSRVNLVLVCGQGQWEDTTGALESTKQFAWLLGEKGIRHEMDLWGHDVPHDWPSWRRQIAHHLPRFV